MHLIDLGVGLLQQSNCKRVQFINTILLKNLAHIRFKFHFSTFN